MKDTHKNNQTKNKTDHTTLEAYMSQQHIPVLPLAVLRYLEPKSGDSYLDLTAGYGGHADAVLGRTLGFNHTFLVDRDKNAVDYLKQKYERSGVNILHQDFLTASQQLCQAGKQFDIILADLGVSSPHLDNTSRGFSFREDGPLDMRMDQQQALTAEEMVNTYDEAQLADIIRRYGEEPKARRIAAAIVSNRPFSSTKQLAAVVAGVYGRMGYSKTHPATRTFQALRIAVNDELALLEQALPLWIQLLKPGGRIVVISFHSLEDRIVKQKFAEQSGNRYDAILTLLTKQPVVADGDELVFNPRARSAKLRAAVKK